MVISPNNEITLLDVPLEIDNKNQLTFASVNAQTTYFSGLTTKKLYNKISANEVNVSTPKGFIDLIEEMKIRITIP